MRHRQSQARRISVALLALASLLISLTPHVPVIPVAQAHKQTESVTAAASSDATRMRVSEAFGKLPLRFESNRGQSDRKVKFLSRGSGYTLFLMATEAVLRLSKPDNGNRADAHSNEASHAESTEQALLRMKLMGANSAARVSGERELQGRSNYLIGNDQTRWHTDIPTFSRVRYEQVYKGIDAVYYGTNQRQLEYDFIVGPGADSRAIALRFEGAERISLDERGDLVLEMKAGQIVQRAPVVYQETADGKQMVECHYVLRAGGEVGFEVAEYDRSRELVIDPQLLYATYYGGIDFDTGEDIAVDASGNAYITGVTLSPDLLLKNAYDGNFSGGGGDAYVVKLNPAGTDFGYATYLGGANTSDHGRAIAVMSDGKACVAGSVNSVQSNSDFPITSNAYQGNPSILNPHGVNAFVTVLSPGGNGLAYSSFLGGSNAPSVLDSANGIAVDAANKIYVAGEVVSSNFPTKNAFQNSLGGGFDAFIAKFDITQNGNNSLIYSSYLGGSGTEKGHDIAVTPSGVAFIVGVTGSFNFPTKSSSSLPPFDTTQGGVNDAFIAKVSPTGALIYSTYFGGNNVDEAQGVAVDSQERAYVTGFTQSSAATFPLKNAFQPNKIGTSQDAFVAKFNADGTALFYSSFLGGSPFSNTGNGITIDAGGNAYVTGVNGGNFSSINGFPPSVPGGGGLIAKIEASDATGTTTPKLLFMDDFSSIGTAIAADLRGNLYIVGTRGAGLATTPGAFQETFGGGSTDATVVKIGSTFPDTIGVFRTSVVRLIDNFQLRNSNTPGPPDLTIDFGQAGDQPLAGDWDGNGVDDVGVFRNGQFILRQLVHLQVGGNVILPVTINFGQVGDKAVVGDWNGDGIDTPGVFRPSTGQWLLTNGPNTANVPLPVDFTFSFGAPTDTPVAGDWNGDSIDTIGVFRGGANGEWFLRNSNSAGAADISISQFGSLQGVLPVTGDWNGDGVDTIGLLFNGSFFFRNTNTNGPDSDLVFSSFAQAGDIPIAGDWDGLAAPANQPPNSGVNSPSDGSSAAGQTQVFITTCSDNNGWHDIATIDFKIARSDGNGKGVPIVLWAQFDENRNLIRLYDTDLGTWREGVPGANVVLENGSVQLRLAGTTITGSGPTGPSVKIRWEVVFKAAARGNNYKQFLKITDDAGLTTGFDHVGSWSIDR